MMITFQENTELLPFNTFGIAAKARYFVSISSVEEVGELMASELFKKHPHVILGGGSNVLLKSDYAGLVIRNAIKGIVAVSEDDDTITLRVGAGESWHGFVMYCVARDLGGAENLSLIPGTVGAAPMQNIGAYGVEIKNNIVSVEGVSLVDGKVQSFTNEACHFGYRESIFKQELRDKFFISSVTLTLTKRNHRFNTSYGAITDVLRRHQVNTPTVKAISDAVIEIRQSKLPDPAVLGNAGSFFKNPSIEQELHDSLLKQYPMLPSYPGENGRVKISAAWLIEQCGWKGKRVDEIGVHQHQALVLVNYGGGSGEKIWSLAMTIQSDVKEKFNITLQPEVNVIG